MSQHRDLCMHLSGARAPASASRPLWALRSHTQLITVWQPPAGARWLNRQSGLHDVGLWMRRRGPGLGCTLFPTPALWY